MVARSPRKKRWLKRSPRLIRFFTVSSSALTRSITVLELNPARREDIHLFLLSPSALSFSLSAPSLPLSFSLLLYTSRTILPPHTGRRWPGEILNNCFRYFPLSVRPNESPRAAEQDRTVLERELQGRYKGSNLPALNEPRLRTRILGARLAYTADERARGLLLRWQRTRGKGAAGRCRCSERKQIDRDLEF